MNYRMVMRILAGMALLSLVTVTPSAAPHTAFNECSASGYNCNILVTLDRNGFLSRTSNPDMPYYPFPGGRWTDIGSLIGFKNSSNATVYSISLNATPGDPYEAAWICGPLNGYPAFNAANVSIINSPDIANFALPPYYFYNACAGGSCPNPRNTKCDVVFAGGVPKGGATYFTIHNLSPNYTGYFQVSTTPVVPSISFQDTLFTGQTANATLSLTPPNAATVTLTLATTAGTGSAVFAANNSTTLTVNTSGAPVQIPLKGITQSSVASNIMLIASVNSAQRSLSFTVVDPYFIHVLANGVQVSPGNKILITADATTGAPSMPTLTAQLISNGPPLSGDVVWSMRVEYSTVSGTNGDAFSNNFPAAGTRTLTADQPWDISADMAGLFVGGTARITWNYAGEGTKTFTFTIGGQNATKTQFKNYLGTTPWFLHKLVQLESTFLQFNPDNTPKFGAPHGYGLMQVEKPLEQAEGIYIVWHWQANVQAGTRVLNSKNTPSYQFWNRQVEQWQAWNAANPSGQVGSAPNEPLSADCTFGMMADGLAPAGLLYFGDAIWIKQYNGTGLDGQPGVGNYIAWDNSTDPTNPDWRFNRSDGKSPPHNYVELVCSQNP